jgi:hypothetical protein
MNQTDYASKSALVFEGQPTASPQAHLPSCPDPETEEFEGGREELVGEECSGGSGQGRKILPQGRERVTGGQASHNPPNAGKCGKIGLTIHDFTPAGQPLASFNGHFCARPPRISWIRAHAISQFNL